MSGPRKSKKDSWRRQCEELEQAEEYSKLYKILSKEPLVSISNLKLKSEEYTKTGADTIRFSG